MQDLQRFPPVLDGELIAKAKEVIAAAFDALMWSFPALPVGCWIIVLGIASGYAVKAFRELNNV